eukprot:scaffold1301_cov363-Pavlova_lutheri.AAC.4
MDVDLFTAPTPGSQLNEVAKYKGMEIRKCMLQTHQHAILSCIKSVRSRIYHVRFKTKHAMWGSAKLCMHYLQVHAYLANASIIICWEQKTSKGATYLGPNVTLFKDSETLQGNNRDRDWIKDTLDRGSDIGKGQKGLVVEEPEVLEAWTAPTKEFSSLVAPTKGSTDRSTCGPTNVSWDGTNCASVERPTEPNKLVSLTAK